MPKSASCSVNKKAALIRAVGIAGLLMLILAAPVVSQETEPAASFRSALPGYQYQFPRDFFSHADFRIEWWYYTGHLEDNTGRSFGYQLTFFFVLPWTRKTRWTMLRNGKSTTFILHT